MNDSAHETHIASVPCLDDDGDCLQGGAKVNGNKLRKDYDY